MSKSRGLDALRDAVDVSVADAEGYLKLGEAIALADRGHPVPAKEFLELAGYYRRAYDLNTDLGYVFMKSVDALKKRNAQIGQLTEALRRVEYSAPDHHGYRICHCCGSTEHSGSESCAVAVALAAVAAPGGESHE